MLKPFSILILFLLVIAGCRSDGPESLPFSELQSLTASIDDETKLTLFEGLPHPFLSPHLLESELRDNKTFATRGFNYYQQSHPVSSTDRELLTGLTKSRKTFTEYSGGKLCGGYHPDFLLRWENRDGVLDVEICLGCQETKIFCSERFLHTDLTYGGLEIFESILENYLINRKQFYE